MGTAVRTSREVPDRFESHARQLCASPILTLCKVRLFDVQASHHPPGRLASSASQFDFLVIARGGTVVHTKLVPVPGPGTVEIGGREVPYPS